MKYHENVQTVSMQAALQTALFDLLAVLGTELKLLLPGRNWLSPERYSVNFCRCLTSRAKLVIALLGLASSTQA